MRGCVIIICVGIYIRKISGGAATAVGAVRTMCWYILLLDRMVYILNVPAADSVGEQHTSMVPLINVLKIFIFELQQL